MISWQEPVSKYGAVRIQYIYWEIVCDAADSLIEVMNN